MPRRGIVKPGPRFLVALGGVGWRVLLPTTGAHVAALAEVASLAKAVTPIRVTPVGHACTPGGFRETPPEPATPRWRIGLASGAVLTVVPDVMPCGQVSMSYAADAYATINGQAVRAGDLVPRLVAIAQTLPVLTPLTVRPDAVAPGMAVGVTGEGWVGGSVDLSVSWCHQLGPPDCVVRALATASVGASGRWSWSGALPPGLPTRGYRVSLEGRNPLLDASVRLRLR